MIAGVIAAVVDAIAAVGVCVCVRFVPGGDGGVDENVTLVQESASQS
jgi:hypothetical protein